MHKLLTYFIISFFAVYKQAHYCYPTSKSDFESLPVDRDEEHFPNGSVVGKYTYSDDQGNPVHVKYFADDASYGVELKSVKVIDSASESTLPSKSEKLSKTTVAQFKFPSDILNTNYPFKNNKQKTSNPYYFLNRDLGKAKHKRFQSEKVNSDYDIFYQNDLTSPKNCAYGKIRLYSDKEKRKIRSVINNFDADTFCEKL